MSVHDSESAKGRIWNLLFGSMHQKDKKSGYQGSSDFDIYKDLVRDLMNMFDPRVGFEEVKKAFEERQRKSRVRSYAG